MNYILPVFLIIILVLLAAIGLYMLMTGRGAFFITTSKARREKCNASLIRLTSWAYLIFSTLLIVSIYSIVCFNNTTLGQIILLLASIILLCLAIHLFVKLSLPKK